MSKRDVLWVLAAVALTGCSSISEAKRMKEVTVELSSVTLADNCAPVPPAPPAPPAKPAPGQPAAPSRVAQDPARPGTPAAVSVADPRCASTGCGRHCEQTSMQLSIKAEPGAKPTTIKVKKVELLDDKGKLLEVLTAREPTQWAQDGKYVVWDQALAADQTVKASYALTAPSWDKLTNGRWNAHARTFQLRVTVTVGSGDITVDKQAITAARLPPAVPT